MKKMFVSILNLILKNNLFPFVPGQLQVPHDVMSSSGGSSGDIAVPGQTYSNSGIKIAIKLILFHRKCF